jgi:hypothetical protein
MTHHALPSKMRLAALAILGLCIAWMATPASAAVLSHKPTRTIVPTHTPRPTWTVPPETTGTLPTHTPRPTWTEPPETTGTLPTHTPRPTWTRPPETTHTLPTFTPRPTCTPRPTRTAPPTRTATPTRTAEPTKTAPPTRPPWPTWTKPPETTHTLPTFTPRPTPATVTVEGKITAILNRARILQVDSQLVQTNAKTSYVDASGNALKFKDLAVGDCVKASGRSHFKMALIATTIEKDDCTTVTPTMAFTPTPTLTPVPSEEPTPEPTTATQ